MAKKKTKRFYAVQNGRDGPMIYHDWPSCEQAVSGFPGARHKGFDTFQEAETYLITPQWEYSFGHSSLSHPTSARATLPSYTMMPGAFVTTKTEEEEYMRAAASASTSRLLEQEATEVKVKESRTTVEEDFIPLEPPTSMRKAERCNSGAEVNLSEQQRSILKMVELGRNVFFTGSAGTGKSVLLRAIINELRGSNAKLGVTASTGIASVNIGGITLHSWAGIGLGKEPVKDLVGKVHGKPQVKKRWRETQALVIDEISMIDGNLFDKIEEVARTIRDSRAPFGGIQLIISGDFCQLPPVPDKLDGFDIPIKFAFEAETWESCVGTPIILSTVFRQRDLMFVNMLNDMRFGRMTPQSINRFKSLTRPVKYDDGIEPTELFPLRAEVEKANSWRLQKLPDPSHKYVARDAPGRDSNGNLLSPGQMNQILERMVVVREVELKIGAQVMLIKNMVQGKLVNGSLGQVVNFKSIKSALEEGYEIAKVDKTEPGKPPEKIQQSDLDPDALAVSVSEGIANPSVWPVVRFTNGRELLCVPVPFTAENAKGQVEATRLQIPLILAWALSMHKSQGQTLERVKVDLGRTFEKGQAYVALSRATKLDTLQVLNFDPRKVQAHPRVIAWYEELQNNINEAEMESIHVDMGSEDALRSYFGD